MATEKAPNVPPFVRFCTASVPMVFDNSMSYYECLCALTKFIQDLVNTVNFNATQLDGLQEAFKELKDYVDNYFDNLDVQAEIDAKLDEMAEGGQLAGIIAQFLAAAPVFAYHTIAEMAAATNLANGCIARVIGNTAAADGDGAYYLIRTRIEADDPDGLNLVAIGDTLVGVRVQDAVYNAISAAIENVEDELDNKYNRTDNISLQNYLTYDMNGTYYSQGSTIDENGTVYIYTSNTSYNGGNLLVFDKITETLTNTISTNFKHGGSMTKKGSYIYVAPCDDTNDILVYNTSTGTVTRNTTLESETAYANCIGVTDYDTNNILVVLGQTGYNANVMGLAPYVFNVNDNSFETITLTNSKGFNLSMFYAYQDVAYNNGHIYILVSQPNCILDFYINGENADLQKIYQVPRRDLLGLTIGEVEGISFIPDSDIVLLTTHCDENANLSSRTIKMYFTSFDSELPQLYHGRLVTDTESYFDVRYLDNSKTSLYENGSETYPFKSFTRAVESATHSTILTGNQVRVKSGTYNVGRIYNANAVISLVDSEQVVEFNGGNREMKIGNCNFYIVTNEGSLTFNVPNSPYVIAIDDNSNISIRGLVTFNSTLEISAQSTVKIENGKFDYNNQSKNIRIIQGSNATIIVNNNSTHPSGALFTLSSNSVLTTNIGGDTQFFDLGDQGPCWTKIMTGLHSADS